MSLVITSERATGIEPAFSAWEAGGPSRHNLAVGAKEQAGEQIECRGLSPVDIKSHVLMARSWHACAIPPDLEHVQPRFMLDAVAPVPA